MMTHLSNHKNMTYTIAKIVGLYDKKKDGTEYRTTKGDTFKKGSVVFAEDPEKIVGLFVWGNQTCEVGMKYEGVIEEGEYNGKPQYTLNGVQVVDKNAERIAQLEFTLANHAQKIEKMAVYLRTKPWQVAEKPFQQPDFDPATNPNIGKVTDEQFNQI